MVVMFILTKSKHFISDFYKVVFNEETVKKNINLVENK